MRSLRTRLLLAFALLTTVTAAAVAGGMYVNARDVIVQQTQDAAVRTMTDRVSTARLQLPPSGDGLIGVLSDRDTSAKIVYNGQSFGDQNLRVSPELRAEVRTGRVAWQRVSGGGSIWLVVGMAPVNRATNRPYGVELYTQRRMDNEDQRVNQLATIAWGLGAASLVLAMTLAWLAARGVLRPVRDLDMAAHRLGLGDLTTRVPVRGTDELAGVARTFNVTASALEHQVGELRRFVADVSHELRTPLAAMTAVADILDEEAPNLPGDAGQAARLVSQETRNLTRLVDDLMEISRFDSGTAGLALDAVDLAAAITATLHTRGWLDMVETRLPPIVAPVDRRRLDVIVANLVGNALRHGAAPVSVTLDAFPGWVVITVSDNGKGLPAEVLPHVFDRFYKADTARSRSEGSGLGLAIAWENAHLHHGTLVAANRPDGGAVFTLRLPSGTTS
ncbi:HAMP domain-containing sensor histidine kinase [Actinocrispum sp. NPDC049592]|uniref:HAMP domain-containing sensor histidine kinase n=1 Tax=Actinocrispum sp. NPDC049592 TaxID=3154835 RepID=UPI003436ACE8